MKPFSIQCSPTTATRQISWLLLVSSPRTLPSTHSIQLISKLLIMACGEEWTNFYSNFVKLWHRVTLVEFYSSAKHFLRCGFKSQFVANHKMQIKGEKVTSTARASSIWEEIIIHGCGFNAFLIRFDDAIDITEFNLKIKLCQILFEIIRNLHRIIAHVLSHLPSHTHESLKVAQFKIQARKANYKSGKILISNRRKRKSLSYVSETQLRSKKETWGTEKEHLNKCDMWQQKSREMRIKWKTFFLWWKQRFISKSAKVAQH